MNVKKDVVKKSYNLMVYGESAIEKLNSLPRSKRGKYVSELILQDINQGLTEKQRSEVKEIVSQMINNK